MKPQLFRYRRPLAVLCAVLAVLLVRLPSAPPSLTGSPVLAAARDLPSGTRLTAEDVRTVRLQPPPSGALVRLPENAALAAPVRRGEPLTDLRLLGPDLLAAHGPGLVAAAVRISDRSLASLVRPGDRVDVLPALEGHLTAPGSSAPPSGPLVTAAPVLAAPPTDETTGALLLLAVTRPEATALAATPHLTLTLHPPP